MENGQVPEANDESDWRKYLTPELQRHFEQTGQYLVEQQVLTRGYSSVEKRKAAMVWLGDTSRRAARRPVTLAVVNLVVTAVASVIAALGGAYWGAQETAKYATQLQDQQTQEQRQLLVHTLHADLASLLVVEEARANDVMGPAIQRLRDMPDYQNPKSRQWLIAPAPTAFPVFEQNASRLGLLPGGLARDIVRLYGEAYGLRSHINTVTGPALIFARREDQEHAIVEYVGAFGRWTVSAKALLAALASIQQPPR